MATFNKFETFVEDLANKVHNLSADSIKVALCAAANPPDAEDGQLSDLTTVSLASLLDNEITVTSSTQVDGVYRFIVVDKTLEASGGPVGPFQYVVLYNDTAANDELICFYDIGFEITLSDTETLLLDFNQANGVLSLT